MVESVNCTYRLCGGKETFLLSSPHLKAKQKKCVFRLISFRNKSFSERLYSDYNLIDLNTF